MEDKLFQDFHSGLSRERWMNERPEVENREQEETVNNGEERTTGRGSGSEYERQLNGGQGRWRDEGDGSLADDEGEDDDDDEHGMSFAFTPLVKIVRKTAEKQTECYNVRADDVRADDVRADDVRADDVGADDVGADDVGADDVGADDVGADDVRVDDVGADDVGADDVRADDVRADDVRVDDVRADDVRADDVGADDVGADDVRADDVCAHWENKKKSSQSCRVCCGEIMSSVLFFLAGVVMFPLLVWGGHDLLPLDLPVVRSTPSRLVYTLRCVLFATFPIILGVLVHGVSCLKSSSLNPLFEGKNESRQPLVHMTYVQDSLRLLLLFFVQLAVMSTYVHHDALQLVPLLTIVFVFGRLIYWPSVCFGSSVRVLGFSLSFLPVLVLMGLNLYFICSSTGEGAVFNVAPPTTPPPPKVRWWG